MIIKNSLILFFVFFISIAQQKKLDIYDFIEKYPDFKWAEPEIIAFEKLDGQINYPDDSVLFIGSSSIRLWDSLEDAMSPINVIKRGYGGAHYRDLIYYTDRILNNHSISMLVCFVANDISGSIKDSNPQEVLYLYKFFINQVREKNPDIPIVQIEITPTLSRWRYWSKINKVNQLIKEYCDSSSNMYYIETASFFLNEVGMPNDNLFIKDQLHLNNKGYDIWNKIIKDKIISIKNL